MIAVVAVLPVFAVTVAASAGATTRPAQVPPLGRPGILGLHVGPGTVDRAGSPAATSGNLLLDKGVLTPLADVPGSAMTAYVDTNNRGEFAGYADAATATAQLRGFLRDARGRFTKFDAPGATQTLAFGLNDRGRVVGGYVDGGAVHGFARNPGGGFTTFDVPGAAVTQAMGINNRDQIVGVYGDAGDGARRGFIRTGDSFTTIDVPGAVGRSGAFDINDRGEIVGGYQDTQGMTHGFRLRDGVFTTIDPPGARDTLCPGPPGCRADIPGFAATAPLGINNRGQVVGQYADAQGLHAYLLDHGVYTTIDPPGGTTIAADINDRGQIVLPGPLGLFIQYSGPS
ncbi:hypothetical protein ACIA5D_43870 [Actinoplanes sp. NPDC051513]|uniref:hypothetical protein n=1 Tax=Actinoplanes sp. NPDC051513 TaxID=3363908 RepID=UPI0037A98721